MSKLIIAAKWKGAGPSGTVYFARDHTRTRRPPYWSTLRLNAEQFPDGSTVQIRSKKLLDQVINPHFETLEG